MASLKVEHMHSTFLSNPMPDYIPMYLYTHTYVCIRRKDMHKNIQNTSQNNPKQGTAQVSINSIMDLKKKPKLWYVCIEVTFDEGKKLGGDIRPSSTSPPHPTSSPDRWTTCMSLKATPSFALDQEPIVSHPQSHTSPSLVSLPLDFSLKAFSIWATASDCSKHDPGPACLLFKTP